MSDETPDFTAHKFPSLAVPCPSCKKRAGAMCIRPSGHSASEPHASRGVLADEVFIALHGEDASVDSTPDGYVIDPTGYAKRRAQERQQAEVETSQ